MSHKDSNLGPVRSAERIQSLDVLRGVALLGILLMNITGFGLVWMAYEDPTIQGGSSGRDLGVWIINNLFFEGTMRAMFSMLFGVGMILMTERMIGRGAGIETAYIYYRRTIWLFLFGIIHAYLILWPGDILYAYGLFGLFLFPFRETSAKKLIRAVVVLTLIGFALTYYQHIQHLKHYEQFKEAASFSEMEAVPDEIKEGKEAWETLVAELKPDEDQIKEDTEKMHQGYSDLVLYYAPLNRYVQTDFNYDYNPWDVLSMMLLGIALFKLKIITAERPKRFYLTMLLLGYVIGLSVNYYETMLLINNDFSVPAFLQVKLSYPIGRIAVAFGHIGLIMLFCKSSILGFLKTALAAVGKMALTNYIMHSVVCAFIFYGIGFSMFGKLSRFELYYVVLGIWLFQLIASPIWLKYYRFGPLEWVWRSLTYQKKQAFKRN